MAKLVEHGGCLIPSKQRRLSFRSLGKVAHIIYNRQLVAQLALLGKRAHPCATALGWPTEIVNIEQCQLLAILVHHVEHLHILVVGGQVGTFLERKSVSLVGGKEHAINQHRIEVEIGFHLIFREVELLLLHLSRIIETVVRLQFEISSHGFLRIRLDGARFLIGLWRASTNQLLEESVQIVHIFRHCIVQRVSRIILESHQFGLLCTQLCHLNDDGEGVEISRSVGTMNRSIEHTLAQCTVFKACQDGLLRGVGNHDAVRRLAITALSVFLALCDIRLTQSGQVFNLVHPNGRFVGSFWQHVTKILLQFGYFVVDFFHALFLICRQQSPRTHEVLIHFLQQLFVFALQLIVFVIVNIFDSIEERLVERHLVVEIGEQRHSLVLYFFQLRGLVCAGKSEEDTGYSVEQYATLFVSQNGVLECRRVFVVHNGLDGLTLLFDTSFHRWQKMFGFDFTKIRRAKR